jgi:hypothetical protein
MVEELSDLALSVVQSLGDPLMAGALLMSILLLAVVTILIALWRLSRKVVHVLKGQKEIKALITEALVISRDAPSIEASPVPEPTQPQEIPHSMGASSPSRSTDPEQQEESTPRSIVQTYRAGKSLYLLYSDGSVEADTDGHIQTFSSIHLLKEAMARKNQNTHLRAS